MTGIDAWLEALDPAPLECDGMTRAISTLMQREGLSHRVFVGQLEVERCGVIPTHWWIELPDGRICDLRARMWLGRNVLVPHGLFFVGVGQRYSQRQELAPYSVCLSSVVFELLVGRRLEAFPLIASSEVFAHA